MQRLFGVPYSAALREEFSASLLQREATSPEDSAMRRALDAHDGYLEVVANRSSGLVGCYSIFLAILIFLTESSTGGLKTALTLFSLMLAMAVLMLLPCLWVYWQRQPVTYADTEAEYRSTMRLLYRRSTLFNGSIVLSVLAILGSTMAFGIDALVRLGWSDIF